MEGIKKKTPNKPNLKGGFCLLVLKPFTKGFGIISLVLMFFSVVSCSERRSHSLPSYSLTKSVFFSLCAQGDLGWVAAVCTEAQLRRHK